MNTPVSTPVSPSAGSPSTPNRIATKSDSNLIWLDMEMTGLNPENDRIVEAAVVVTGSELNTLAEDPILVIRQSDELLDGMGAWNKDTHGRLGLIDKVKASTTTEAEAKAELSTFLRKWVPKNKPPMCGNSICQDRRFMARYMPKLEEYFHYRSLDIFTFKEPCKRQQPTIAKGFTKHQRHAAFTDIIESTEELRYYHEHSVRDVPQTPDAEALTSSVVP